MMQCNLARLEAVHGFTDLGAGDAAMLRVEAAQQARVTDLLQGLHLFPNIGRGRGWCTLAVNH